MNFGKTILELRKKKNVTQEDIAAQLGVTAAAVSKWENGYTLPDILMLCALADYFQVTTDELLGRAKKQDMAIVLAETEELGRKIANLAERYNIQTAVVLRDLQSALAVIANEEADNKRIKYLFDARKRKDEEANSEEPDGVLHIHVSADNWSDENVLAAMEVYLKNMDSLNDLAQRVGRNN